MPLNGCLASPKATVEGPRTRIRGAARSLRLALLLVSVAPTKAYPQLSPSDSTQLTLSLNTIAATPTWIQSAVDSANAVFLRNSTLAGSAWASYFLAYFRAYPMTEPLYAYLLYPTFFWLGTAVNDGLQAALPGALRDNVDSLLTSSAVGLGPAMFASASLRDDLIFSVALLNWLAVFDISTPSSAYAFYKHLVAAYPQFFSSATSIDPVAEAYVGVLRRQVHCGLVMAQPLTPMVISDLEATLALGPNHRQLLETHGILMSDNNGSTAAQWAALQTLYDVVPGALSNLRLLTVNDFLGVFNVPAKYHFLGIVARPGANVNNIFGLPVGSASENSFPPDAPVGLVDVYTVVGAHELNHVVDAGYVAGNAGLRARELALLAAAGNPSANYLRSMFPSGFFANAPQEFLASIANQWFTDAENTVRLGRIRFDAGLPEPINQALFMAEIYSLGGDTTELYRYDASTQLIARTTAPISRDGAGHLNAIHIGDTLHTFSLDPLGNVTGYTSVSIGPATVLSVSPLGVHDSAIAGSGASIPDSVALVFAGTGTSPWSVTHRAGANWNTLTTVNGVGNGWVYWTKSAAGLSPGVYVDTIAIIAHGSFNSPARVLDTLVVLTPLTAALTASRVDSAQVGATAGVTDSVPLALSGFGAGTASWTASHGAAPWLLLTTPSGVGSATVRWVRDPSGLAIGTYVDTITVTVPGALGSPARIIDSLRVLAPLSASLNAASRRDSIPQGSTTAKTDSVTLALAGYASSTAAWTVTHGAGGWLTVTTPAGVGSGKVRWRRDPTALVAGLYVDTVRIAVTGVAGGPAEVIDSLRIFEPAVAVSCAETVLLSTSSCLGAIERNYLDQTGNRDGSYNLGDLLAFLDRKGLPLSPPVLELMAAADSTQRAPRSGRRP